MEDMLSSCIETLTKEIARVVVFELRRNHSFHALSNLAETLLETKTDLFQIT